MALSVTVLGSGSSGNSTLVSDGERHVLIDIGLSGRETARRLAECGLAPEGICAVVVSHEHGDHCRGVAPFVKDLGIPVYLTAGALKASGMILPEDKWREINSSSMFDVCGMRFTPFAVSHDGVDPIGFTVEKDGVKIAVVLDLGYISNLVAERLRGCDCIVLESNHDIRMLKFGPYPWSLKQRVMSRRGHLSNESVAEFLSGSFDGKARTVILAHLSKKNNLPELALVSAQKALQERSALSFCQTKVELAKPDEIGKRHCF
jgi:phosphoribosyl 1,2-cyclic phosphodiesterase